NPDFVVRRRPARHGRCRFRRRPAGRSRAAGKPGRHAQPRHEHGPSRSPLRRPQPEARIARWPEAPVAGHQPLGLSGFRRLFREEPRHRRRRAEGSGQRGRPQARHPLTQASSTCPPPGGLPPGRSMSDSRLRFPAEWEPQSAILIAWPHAGTDCAERLGEVEETYIALVAAIARFQRVLACVAEDEVDAYARARLASARGDMDRVTFVPAEYDGTWLRDSGPVTLREAGGFRLLDFRFTGWGGEFEAGRDDHLVERLDKINVFLKSSRQAIDFALEGGAIDTAGTGTLLTTWQCLHERHPAAPREELTRRLADWL